MHTANETTVFLDSGTIVGTVSEMSSAADSNEKLFQIPEIVITGSSSNNLNQSQSYIPQNTTITTTATQANNDIDCDEGVALLQHPTNKQAIEIATTNIDEFEQFILNRTISENNMLDTSIYSELQFQPSVCSGGSGGYMLNDALSVQGNVTSANAMVTSGQQPAPQVIAPNQAADVLNTSLCSRESRQSRRQRRKHKTKSKCSRSNDGNGNIVANYPPRYTAIFMEPQQQHHHQQHQQQQQQQLDHVNGNAIGQTAGSLTENQIAFMPQATSDGTRLLPTNTCTYYPQRPLLNLNQRNLFEPQQPQPTVAIAATTAQRMNICKWFSRPSLPLIIGIFALGGVACTLGGIVLGSTGLIEHSTQYLSAALLMIGIGVSLLVIAGAIWRISLPDDYENCHCYRHMETCLNCNNPYCYNRMTTNGYFYPEFQYRTPPPSYLTSLNEYAAMSLLFHPTASTQRAADTFNTMRINTPPPLYRSTNSLSSCAATYASPPLPPTGAIVSNQPTTSTNGVPVLTRPAFGKQSQHSLNVVPENVPAEMEPPLTKELNYLELD